MSTSTRILMVGFVIAGALVVAAQLSQSAPAPVPLEPIAPAPVVDRLTESGAVVAPLRTAASRLPPPMFEEAPAAPTSARDVETEEQRAARIQRVREEIASELERRRPDARRCLPEVKPGVPTGGISLQIVVDAEGREIARGVSESRELGSEISSCLRQALSGAVRVNPPGKITDVELPFLR